MRGPVECVPGTLVVMRCRKHNGKPHWVVPGSYLGSDVHGHWIFQPTGSFVARPGIAFYAASDAVLLVPHSGNHVATFYDKLHPDHVEVYVDLAADVQWSPLVRGDGLEVTLVDMALDVIRTSDSRGTWVDDEDEFAAHAELMHYPPALIESTRAECAGILGRVNGADAPFDGTAAHGKTAAKWFAKGQVARICQRPSG